MPAEGLLTQRGRGELDSRVGSVRPVSCRDSDSSLPSPSEETRREDRPKRKADGEPKGSPPARKMAIGGAARSSALPERRGR